MEKFQIQNEQDKYHHRPAREAMSLQKKTENNDRLRDRVIENST
jgi:hypothetical protein